MSRLLVVISRNAQLEGVVADSRGEQDGAEVFYLGGAEVARALPGEPVVVRDLRARRCAWLSPVTLARPTIWAAG